MINRFFQHNRSRQCAKALVAMLLVCAGGTVSAEDWYSLNDDPKGKVSHPPVQLEKYPLAKNTEKHFPPNQEFTL